MRKMIVRIFMPGIWWVTLDYGNGDEINFKWAGTLTDLQLSYPSFDMVIEDKHDVL